jgi:anti-anti-sigma factor
MADVEQFAMDYQHRDGHVVVRVSGELDAATAPRLLEGLTARADASVRRVELDVAGVGFIDSTGLRALLESRERALAAGTRFRLANPSAAALRLFHLTGTHDMLLDEETATGTDGSSAT